MKAQLTTENKRQFLKRGFTRRNFGRLATMITAGATLPFYNEPALAQLSRVDAAPDAVLINANENPLGPCAEAREAAHSMIQYGGRYRYNSPGPVYYQLDYWGPTDSCRVWRYNYLYWTC